MQHFSHSHGHATSVCTRAFTRFHVFPPSASLQDEISLDDDEEEEEEDGDAEDGKGTEPAMEVAHPVLLQCAFAPLPSFACVCAPVQVEQQPVPSAVFGSMLMPTTGAPVGAKARLQASGQP